MALCSPDDRRADTSCAQGLRRRGESALQPNGSALKYGAVFIRFIKLFPENSPGGTPAAAVADMFAAQAELRGYMCLLKQGRLKDGLFFFNKVLDGKVGFRPINTSL
jgi:hypothetical protein